MIPTASRCLRWILGAVVLTSFAVAESDDITGVWEMDNGKEKAHIEIVKSDGVYSGKIIWLENPIYPANDPKGMGGRNRVDRLNPDESLRERPIIGLEILTGLRRMGDGTFAEGQLYAPDRGKSYQCKGSLGPDGGLQMRGFIGVSFIGRTMDWVRVGDAGS